MASIEEFERAGLLDPAADPGSGRLELLHWLDERGFSIEEMATALEGGGLGALAGDRKLVPGVRLTDEQTRERIGLSETDLDEIATAFGFTHRVDHSSEGGEQFLLTGVEADALAMYSVAFDMFSRQEAVGFIRVVGTAMSRIADAVVSLFLTDVEGPYLAVSTHELELARKVLGAVELLEDFVPLLDVVLRRHILQSIERTRLTVIDEQERLLYRYAVGFVDLVGFTPLSQEMTARQLGEFIREFEGRAHHVITAAGARLVKLIGDEVMFVAPGPDSACRVSEALMTGFEAPDGRDVVPRAGLAFGEVLVRGGDYYGDIVNLASRLVDEAEPGELLATERFADGATCLSFTPAGQRDLKGFAHAVPVRSVHFGGWDPPDRVSADGTGAD